MTYTDLYNQIVKKKSFLCVGLDTDITKIPRFLMDFEYPAFEFNKRIIDQTAAYTVAYKPNLAFYETTGAAGWINLEMTVSYIREKHPNIMVIADAKRGDIGNTSKMYAKAFFEDMNTHAVTVAPYMGEDSVTPFLTYKNKWVILLALTSNPGANNFQLMRNNENGDRLFESVLKTSLNWGDKENMMYVIGATRAEMLTEVRNIVPDHFLLIPGVGAQGGSLEEVARFGMNSHCGLLVNSSRNIIYADATDRFALVAGDEARKIQTEMEVLLKAKKLI
jgi:orotidine-5'-phosphate decarboxylase